MSEKVSPEEVLSDFSKEAQSVFSGEGIVFPAGLSAKKNWVIASSVVGVALVAAVILIALPEKQAVVPYVAQVAKPSASISSDLPTTGVIQQGGSAVLAEDAIVLGGGDSARSEALFTERDFIVNGLPVIEAQAALVKKLGSSETLFEQGNNKQWPIASLSKLMTGAVALEKLGVDVVVTISENAVATEGVSGNFSTGEQFTVLDLVTAMMAMSSNDAAVAVSDFYNKKHTPTSPEAAQAPNLFVQEMNELAKRLDMTETSFLDPSGLSPKNYSTPADLEKLVTYVVKAHPEILLASRQSENQIIEILSRAPRTLGNINRFAGQFDFVGGKTGFTDEARGNLVSVFNYQGTQYLIVVLGTEDRFGETSRLYRWLKTKLAE